MLEKFLPSWRAGTRSLKTALSVYFIPISIIPAIFISYYAISVFDEGTKDNLASRALSERDALVAEIDSLESDLVTQIRAHATSSRLLTAVKNKNKDAIAEAIASYRDHVSVRVFSAEGVFLAGKNAVDVPDSRVSYISKEGLRRVKTKGETVERFFSPDTRGFITVARVLLKDKYRLHGIIEEEYAYGPKDLADLKNRRQVDVVFFNRDFNAISASFALSPDVLKNFSQLPLQSPSRTLKSPVVIPLGDTRYATFVYDLPAPFGKTKKWGFIALFLSMTSTDVSVAKLKLAIAYLTALLILISTLLIFVFSNRLVRPIEMLVLAMKRIKSGRMEQISPIDSTYEIEYLVHSFNQMAHNVSAAKRALELKLEELHRANSEIKNAQTTLVQSAKMASLGQIVAGVAHELNNPIGFIYSNMHHLSTYIEKLKEMVTMLRVIREKLPKERQKELDDLEKRLEIDFILKDMEDLTKSCVDGATRTKEIVLGLRTFSRSEEAGFRQTDLHEGLRSTAKLLSSEFKERVTLHEDFGVLPLVECNPSQINQVFMNLLSNAAQAISGRGEIWIRTKPEGDYASIEIQDTGSGISKEHLEKIFDPFFTTKRVGEGTGLGLSIAYELVRKHDGRIDVTSTVGKGTSFKVLLPIHQKILRSA